jgi:hypothetical protein
MVYIHAENAQSGFIDSVNFKGQAQGPSGLLVRWQKRALA